MRSLIVLLMVSALLVPAYAARHMMPSMMMRGGMMMGPMMGGSMIYSLMGYSALDTYVSYQEELGLTDEQVKKLKAIRSGYKKETAERNAEITRLQSELDELYDADELDYKAIGKKVGETEAVQSKLRSAYFDALDKADKVLTKEQRKKIQKLTGAMMHEMEKMPSLMDHRP